jgi:hypothetical protein
MPIDYQAAKQKKIIGLQQVHKIYNDHEKIHHPHPGSFIHRGYFVL